MLSLQPNSAPIHPLPRDMGDQGDLFRPPQSTYSLNHAGSLPPLTGLNEILFLAKISGILHVGTPYHYMVPVGILVPPLAPAQPLKPQQ